MAVGGNKFGNKGAKAGAKSGMKKDGGVKRLQQYRHFGKFILRAFPDNDGSVFYTGKKMEKIWFVLHFGATLYHICLTPGELHLHGEAARAETLRARLRVAYTRVPCARRAFEGTLVFT